MKEETATLYTYDVTQYGADENNAEVRKPERTLYLAWVHKQDNSLVLIHIIRLKTLARKYIGIIMIQNGLLKMKNMMKKIILISLVGTIGNHIQC